MTSPVFLAGASRSGKTLLRSILAEHPRIAPIRRTDMWPRFYKRYGDLDCPKNFDRCLTAMLERKQIAALDVDILGLRREFERGPRTYARLFALMNEQYVRRCDKARWLDQTAGIDAFADEVMAAYPGARMLHMMRDPRDCFAAIMQQGRTRRLELGRFANDWVGAAERATCNQLRYPEAYFIVYYEQLVLSPEMTINAICTAIGEDYVPSMLALDSSVRYRDGRTSATLISARFISQYNDVLSPRAIAHLRAVAGRQMRHHGYGTAETLRTSATERLRAAASDWPVSLTRMIRASGV